MSFSKASLKYLGGIRTPHEMSSDIVGDGQDGMNYGGTPFALDYVRREFVCGTRNWRVARLRMIEPAEHTDNNVNTFPVAPYVVPTMVELSGQSQLPDPPIDGHSWFEMLDTLDPHWAKPSGVQPIADQVLASGIVYFDANNDQRRSVFLGPWPPVPPASSYQQTRTPFRSIGEPTKQGLVAGYFAPIPEVWRERLKGDVLMGNSSLPIIYRGSAGPCATSFWAKDIVNQQQVPTTLLVGYPAGHFMEEHPWNNPDADPVYSQATQITGMAVVGDTLVFVGSHGYGKSCYGPGTWDENLVGTQPPYGGESYCYDPANSYKGTHAYPYRIQVWHYPLADLEAVAQGLKNPWDLRPEWFELDVPFQSPQCVVNGCGYDPQAERFFLSVYAADGYGYEPGPVIYAYEYEHDAEPPVEPPIESPPEPPIESPPEPEDPCLEIRKQLLMTTVALDTEKQAHNHTKEMLGMAQTNLSSIHTEANGILSQNDALKPKDRLPKWCVDAVKRIEQLSKASATRKAPTR